MKKYLIMLIIFIIPYFCFALNSTYNNSEYHFSISIPENWSEINNNELEKLKGNISNKTEKLGINNIDSNSFNKMIGGYKFISENDTNIPYLLIIHDKASITFPKENELSMIKEEYQKILKNINNSYIIENISLNENVKGIIMDIKGTLNGNEIKYKSAMLIGKDEVIYINFYPNNNNYEQFTQTFNEIINSFKFDTGYSYSDKSINNEIKSKDNLELFIKGGTEGIIFLIVLSLLFYNAKGKKENDEEEIKQNNKEEKNNEKNVKDDNERIDEVITEKKYINQNHAENFKNNDTDNIKNEKSYSKNKGNNFIEKLFFSWFFRPKFVDLSKVNKSKGGRLFILIYMIIFIVGILMLPIEEKCTKYIENDGSIQSVKTRLRKETIRNRCVEYNLKIGNKDSEEYIIQLIIFYFFMTLSSSLGYKSLFYITNGSDNK